MGKYTRKKMVRGAGFEPANGVFSSLLIVAFLFTCLQVMLRQFPHDCKHYFASMGN
jgi:hypothetical protein